jgi:hypothetical protein
MYVLHRRILIRGCPPLSGVGKGWGFLLFMSRRLERYHGRGELHFITFRVRRSPPLRGAPFPIGIGICDRGSPAVSKLPSKPACGRQARGNPSGLRVKQGKQKFFASWFHRGRGRDGV